MNRLTLMGTLLLGVLLTSTAQEYRGFECGTWNCDGWEPEPGYQGQYSAGFMRFNHPHL